MSDSDDDPGLSASTLAALQDFYTERTANEERFSKLKADAEEAAQGRKDGTASGNDAAMPLSMDLFAEDWQESQFWYSEKTATELAGELLEEAGGGSRVAVVSAPSVFVALKNLLAKAPAGEPRPKLLLLEHDARFEVFGDEFHWYDFNAPLKLPTELKGTFDRIICDPPFLTEECQTGAAVTVRWLAKPDSPHGFRLVVDTGERMEQIVHKVYKTFDVYTTDYEIEHARGLSNEFRCYANFESGLWKQRTDR